MSPNPLDYSTQRPKKQLHPTVKWILIVVVLIVLVLVGFAAYMSYYVGSLGRMGN